ncbi:MAG: trigger factor [Firmicutes bacterium]|nr:trigger factor [Bacillota bacterium]
MNVTAKFEFTTKQIEEAIDVVYKRDAAKYKVKGFRQGAAPRKMIEQNHGDVFSEEAFNKLFNEAFKKYLADNKEVTPVDDPDVTVEPTEKGLVFVATIPVQDKFTLGKYTGIEIKLPAAKIGDKDVDAFLERIANSRARQIAAAPGHKIKDGDIAVIDFCGYLNGKKFAGGEAKNHELVIGSKSFIDTFEEQLVGKSVKDKVKVNVTFPKEYHAAELAGKPVVFEVEIKNILIREIPAIDDNLAKETSEFKTLAELKKDTRERLEKHLKAEVDQAYEQELLRKIAEGTKINVHEKLTERYFAKIMADLEARLAQSGINIEMYAQYNGVDLEGLKKVQRENAMNSAKIGLVLDAVQSKEKIKNFDEVIKFLKEKNKCTFGAK